MYRLAWHISCLVLLKGPARHLSLCSQTKFEVCCAFFLWMEPVGLWMKVVLLCRHWVRRCWSCGENWPDRQSRLLLPQHVKKITVCSSFWTNTLIGSRFTHFAWIDHYNSSSSFCFNMSMVEKGVVHRVNPLPFSCEAVSTDVLNSSCLYCGMK